MKKVGISILVIMVCVGLVASSWASTPRNHRGFQLHTNYTGHAGCPGYIPAHSAYQCAYHTNVIKIGVWANAYHEVFSNGQACSAGANQWCWIFFSSPQNVQPRVGTNNQAITNLDGEEYQ